MLLNKFDQFVDDSEPTLDTDAQHKKYVVAFILVI